MNGWNYLPLAPLLYLNFRGRGIVCKLFCTRLGIWILTSVFLRKYLDFSSKQAQKGPNKYQKSNSTPKAFLKAQHLEFWSVLSRSKIFEFRYQAFIEAMGTKNHFALWTSHKRYQVPFSLNFLVLHILCRLVDWNILGCSKLFKLKLALFQLYSM